MKKLQPCPQALAMWAFTTALVFCLCSTSALARPVTYTGGKVAMADFHPDAFAWRYGYSGSFRWSASVGGLYVDNFENNQTLDIHYIRGARLLKRWNWPTAQANVFAWGGFGQAKTAGESDFSGALPVRYGRTWRCTL